MPAKIKMWPCSSRPMKISGKLTVVPMLAAGTAALRIAKEA